MKIYLSYKQTGVPKEKLEAELSFIKKSLEKLGHKVFIYYFEGDSSLPAENLDKIFLEKIKESDLILAYVNYFEKSEGQLLELGMAYALGKKIKILVNEKVKDKYYLIYGLGEVLVFDRLEEVRFDEML